MGLRRQNCGPNRLVMRPKIRKLAAIRNVGAMIVVEILSRLAISVTVKPRKYDWDALHKEWRA
jgi:hypothetical protein